MRRGLPFVLAWSSVWVWLVVGAGAHGGRVAEEDRRVTTHRRITTTSTTSSTLSCPPDHTRCPSLKSCLKHNDCSRCVNFPTYQKELGQCVPQPVPFALQMCAGASSASGGPAVAGAGASSAAGVGVSLTPRQLGERLTLSCQEFATQVHECWDTCAVLHPAAKHGEFVGCLARSDGPCPLPICEQACGCIGEVSCAEPCMQRCSAYRDNVLRRPDAASAFPTQKVLETYLDSCVFAGGNNKGTSFLERVGRRCGEK